MITSTFELEEKFFSQGYEIVIGIDEAGRGPLAGPVVACAVALKHFCHYDPPAGGEAISSNVVKSKIATVSMFSRNDKDFFDLIRDSKMLSKKQRESLFDFIHENFYVGIGICDHQTIDRINILEATFLAMKSAVSQLRLKIGIQNANNVKTIILLDGNKNIPNLSIEQKCVIGGDKSVKSISAASIVAKVTRDRMMNEMHEKYPEYDFAKHKGYGTKIHMDVLQKFGPCEIHRRSFAPVKKCLKFSIEK